MSVIEYEIRDATLEDARILAPLLRDVDKQEVWASHMSTPHEALEKSILSSDKPRIGLANSEPVCIFGIAKHTLFSDRGSIWMLGTDLLKRYAVKFLRENEREIVYLSEDFSIIENYCDARNKVTLKWLKWLGFIVHDAKPYGVYNLPFHYFYKEVDKCAS